MSNISQKIVIFCPNWVGDVVMAVPFFDTVRRNYPEAEIIGVVRQYVKGVIEDGPWFDRLIPCNDKTFAGFFKLLSAIRAIKPDIALLLPNSFRSALLARLGLSKKVFGYRRGARSLLLTGGPAPAADKDGYLPMPMQDYYLEICKWLRLDIASKARPALFVSEKLKQKGALLFKKYGIKDTDMLIGINPGAKFGSSKCWPPDYFARLAELITKEWDCKVLLFVGPGEELIAESIIKKSSAGIINTGPDKVDLALLKYLVHACSLLITNDTGPRHYAVAFDLPVLVIMGPTDYRYTNDNLEKTVVLRKEMACSPCHKPVCPREHECMRRIKPEEVLFAAKQLMNRRFLAAKNNKPI